MTSSNEQSAEYEDNFRIVIGYVYNNWTALKMCIEHGMGGNNVQTRNKINDLIEHTLNVCNTVGYDVEDLIDALDDVLDQKFNTIMEDNSTDEIAHEIWEMYRRWNFGDKEYAYNRIKSLPMQSSITHSATHMNTVIRVEESDSSSESSEDEEQTPMDVDEGWTVVKHRK